MDFSLLHTGLAAGAVLAVVPLIIHLALRQTPKRVVFPALQLLQKRHQRSTKRLKVRNWLLLLARMGVIALMALALARPAWNTRIPLGDQEVPTALALVVDTSLSMGYTDLGKTRLDEAKEVGRDLLKKLPETSQVWLIDSGAPGVPVSMSPSAARKRLEGLSLRAAGRPLNQGIQSAYTALADSKRELPRQEVYVLTDLARSSWETAVAVDGRAEAEKKSGRDISTYLIRLAPEEVKNVAIAGLRALPAGPGEAGRGDAFEVVGTVRNVGPATTRLVNFVLDGKKRDQKEVELPADGEVEVRFRTPPNIEARLHQATLQATGTDPLPADDLRHVTFQSRPAHDVLVLYDPYEDDAQRTIDAYFLANALDPLGIGRPNRVELLGTNQLQGRFEKDLGAYAAIFLNNVARLPDAAWNQLATYVRQGGGVVVGLGRRSEPKNYNGEAARTVMPLELLEPTQPAGGTTSFANILDPSHPLINPSARDLPADLAAIPVNRFWAVKLAESPNIRPILAFQDGSPALVEQTFPSQRTGRVLVWTTPLSRRAEPGDPDGWNEFPIAGWSFLAMIDLTVPYLAGTTGQQWNYEAGEFVRLPLASGKRAPAYIVKGPQPDLTERVNLPKGGGELVVEGAQALGHWRVAPDVAGAPADAEMGFSLNAPPGESAFAPLAEEDLGKLFGEKDGYALADSPTSLKRVQRTSRVGRELFPWLMALILGLVTAESYLANRFHREKGASPLSPGPRAPAAAAR